MRRSAGLAASLLLYALTLAGCGHGSVIGSGPLPSPTPTVPKVTNEFSVPTANSSPGGIVTGLNGALYFTEQATGNIGQVTTGGTFVEVGIAKNGGTSGNEAIDITSGPNTNLWFTEQGPQPGIGTMTVSGNKITEYHIAGSAPTYIINGPVQDTMVFSDPAHNAIGTITTSGTVTETPIPTANANPMGLAVLSNDVDHVYFAEHDASKIGILNVQTNTITEVPTLTPNAGPTALVQGPDGALWFTEDSVAKMGRMTSSGLMTEYSLAPATSATALVLAHDNNLYFADPAQNKIGRISGLTGSDVAEYSIPTPNAMPVFPAFPGALTLGPDGLIYFTEPGGNKIGQMIY